MNKPKIYLDNCCYGRPFDNLSQERVRDEASAKRYIQALVKYDSVELHTSFMSLHEMYEIPFDNNREHILGFVNEYSSLHISNARESEVIPLAEEIMQTGIKRKDATHIACAIIAGSDCFITTDKRVLNYKTDKIKIMNPIDFVKLWEGTK